MNNVTISEIMNGAWLERALYTAEERGIPSFADGLKPVQRYLICKQKQALVVPVTLLYFFNL